MVSAKAAQQMVLSMEYDEAEPDWFPNEGDRQWWREQHLIERVNITEISSKT